MSKFFEEISLTQEEMASLLLGDDEIAEKKNIPQEVVDALRENFKEWQKSQSSNVIKH